MFIGVGEANAILKGEKTLATVLKESVAAYKQLPKSLAKLITKTGSKLKTKVIKGVSGLSLMYQLNTAEIKLGTIINQGGKAVVKIEVPMTKGTVLETIEECLYLNADNVVSKGTIEVVEDGGKVGLGLNGARKFTLSQIDDYVALATNVGKGVNKDKILLGEFIDGSPNSYVTRAKNEGYTYFDMGDKWDEAFNLVNKTKDEMWKINKKFIDEQKALNKEFYFSQVPWNFPSTPKTFRFREAEYLIDMGAKDFQKINDNTWKVIW